MALSSNGVHVAEVEPDEPLFLGIVNAAFIDSHDHAARNECFENDIPQGVSAFPCLGRIEFHT